MKKLKRNISIIFLNGIFLFCVFYSFSNMFLAVTEGKIEVCPRAANHGCYFATYQDNFSTFVATFILYGIGGTSVVALYYWYFFIHKVKLLKASSKAKTDGIDNKEKLSHYCNRCKKQGFIEVDSNNLEVNYLVKCSTCNNESSFVWCDECGMGGDFFNNVKAHVKSWSCPECKKEHKLPDNFYKDFIYLKFEKASNK